MFTGLLLGAVASAPSIVSGASAIMGAVVGYGAYSSRSKTGLRSHKHKMTREEELARDREKYPELCAIHTFREIQEMYINSVLQDYKKKVI